MNNENLYDPLGSYIPPELQEYTKNAKAISDARPDETTLLKGAGALAAGALGIHGARRFIAAGRSTPFGAQLDASINRIMKSPIEAYKKGGQQQKREQDIKANSIFFNSANDTAKREAINKAIIAGYSGNRADINPIVTRAFNDAQNPAVIASLNAKGLSQTDVANVSKVATQFLGDKVSPDDIAILSQIVGESKALRQISADKDAPVFSILAPFLKNFRNNT